MLINLQKILAVAEEKNYAIGAFNTPNLECIMAVLQAAERHNVPVIISHAQLHEEIMPLDIIGPVMVNMVQQSSVPACVHLDHGEDISYLRRALEMGFTSVMYDGSTLSYEANVENTQKTVELAQAYNAGVEAELGTIGEREGSGGESAAQMTDPETAKKFAESTKIDALACSFGTAHGFYTQEPKLDFERISKIRELTGLPLVMHGGSGVNVPDYEKSIECGVRKINYYS
ncbi:MAG: class II fructose-bisphosphate aldolase [Defluviitaleaceae bacterium]|nr:class II fructose-bisphosphate aldolase [Defluviitaleaceae bacterium]